MVRTPIQHHIETIEERRREALHRLAKRSTNFYAEPDTVHPGAWIVRNRKIPYRFHLVTPDQQCTCQQFALWDQCRHLAVVATQEGW